jgi:hypothetical protein
MFCIGGRLKTPTGDALITESLQSNLALQAQQDNPMAQERC